jgi:hypothetical protein
MFEDNGNDSPANVIRESHLGSLFEIPRRCRCSRDAAGKAFIESVWDIFRYHSYVVWG